MADSLAVERPVSLSHSSSRFYIFASINLLCAAVAMVATLPGRTYGLGIITEPLMRDFHLTKNQFADQNLWATLIGATFGLAWGPLIDRFGSRLVLAFTLAALGSTVIGFGWVTSTMMLLVFITLTRGFGQAGLSAVSLALVGKWFSRKLPLAMAIYTVIIGVGFTLAIGVFGAAVHAHGWLKPWTVMGWILAVGLAPLALILVRRTPESVGLNVDGENTLSPAGGEMKEADTGLTLAEALRSPAFWAYALSASAFGLINSGAMLFNSSVLKERGIADNDVNIVLAVIVFSGMLANFIGGWLARTWPIGRLMAVAMVLLGAGLVALPLGYGKSMVYVYAVMMGLSAGVVTVAFFICWGQVFGRRHLGAVQGAAQGLTVLASAIGPKLLAMATEGSGSTTKLFLISAPIAGLLGIFCLLAPLPLNSPARKSEGL